MKSNGMRIPYPQNEGDTMWYIDYWYIVLVLPAVLFALIANFMVNSTFERYSKQYTRCGLSGHDAARRVLDDHGLYDVRIECVRGKLTDHYDPRANVIRLSEAVYHSTSSAAVGVAAHEAGHAVQHSQGYLPIKIRSAIIPITNFASRLAVPLILIGMIMMTLGEIFYYVAIAGVVCFGFSTLFQLVTLPTEFNASHRAARAIETRTNLTPNEVSGAKRVLAAAAMTYVAALAVSLMQLIRFALIIANSRGRRRD